MQRSEELDRSRFISTYALVLVRSSCFVPAAAEEDFRVPAIGD